MRRLLLALICCAAFSGFFARAEAPPLSLPPQATTTEGALHALNRLGFGPRPGELAQIQAIGVDHWIARQLDPQAIAEPAALTDRLAALSTLALSDAELYRRDADLARDKSEQGRAARKDYVSMVLREAQSAKLDRALLSDRQLQEVLVGFWFNHFNVFEGKGFDHVWVGAFENEAIRPHVLGSFRDLLYATARHPAMLFYLDNWQNVAPDSRGAHGREAGLNENYARELMELHTLGVDGGYTQKDVTELARILTGVGLRDRVVHPGASVFGRENRPDYTPVFNADRHDYGDKILLGHAIRGEGVGEIQQALDLLASSPATAHHLSFQLAQYFTTDEPDATLVAHMTNVWLRTGGNLTAVMRAMIESPVFWSSVSIGGKFKTPFEYAVSALRVTGVLPDQPQPILQFLRQLGQPIYGIETPDGYKQVEAAWLNPDAMARRLSFATTLGSGRLGQQRFEISDAAIRAVMPALAGQTDQALSESDPRLRAALLLGSPDFMVR